MGVNINYEIIQTEKYNISNLEFYTRGDLKGYVQGLIRFDNGMEHEFLYRVYDPENGDSKTMVSIDYGCKNPMVDEFWCEIEKNVTDVLKGLRVIGSKEDLEFWKTCHDVLIG